MLYHNIHDVLTDADVLLIIDGLKSYSSMLHTNKGAESASALGLLDTSACQYTFEHELRIGMDVNWLIECLGRRRAITADQLRCICCMLQSAIDRYSTVGAKVGPLYSPAMCIQATNVHSTLHHMYAESQVQWSQALPLLADALLGRFGTDCDDSDIWPDIKEYCKTRMPAADDWSMMLAWVMMRTNKHELCDDVFSMADNLLDVINSK